jgi:hypothetical protein
MTIDVTPAPMALGRTRCTSPHAIEVARATKTCLVVYRGGQIVRIPPDQLPLEEWRRTVFARRSAASSVSARGLLDVVAHSQTAGFR